MSHETVSTTPVHEGANAVQANLTEGHGLLGDANAEAKRLTERKDGFDHALLQARGDTPGGLVPDKEAAHEMALHEDQSREATARADKLDEATIRHSEMQGGARGNTDLDMVIDRQSREAREEAHAADLAALEVEKQHRADAGDRADQADKARGYIANIPAQRVSSELDHAVSP
jgi:hypothetical protein